MKDDDNFREHWLFRLARRVGYEASIFVGIVFGRRVSMRFAMWIMRAALKFPIPDEARREALLLLQRQLESDDDDQT